MNKIIILACFLILPSLYLIAQPEKAAIQSSVTNFFDALSTINIDQLKSDCTSDFVLLESGKVWNIDSLINIISPLKAMTFKRVNTLNFITTDQKNDVAWVSYYNTADMTINARHLNEKWVESAVLIKEKDSWKIKLLHSTVIK